MENEQELDEVVARNLPAQVLALKVTNAHSYEIMASARGLLKQAWQFFEDRARPRIDDANKLHKSLLADLKKDHTPIDQALTHANKELGDYDEEQIKIAKRKQAELDAANKLKADEEKRQLSELAKQAGDQKLAQEILDSDNSAPAVVVQKETPQVFGLSFRTDWHYEITDSTLIPAHFHRLVQNEKKEWSCKCITDLGLEVERLKQTANIPGVRVYSKRTPIGRG